MCSTKARPDSVPSTVRGGQATCLRPLCDPTCRSVELVCLLTHQPAQPKEGMDCVTGFGIIIVQALHNGLVPCNKQPPPPSTIMLIVKGCSPWRQCAADFFKSTGLLPVGMTRETSPAACHTESPWLGMNPMLSSTIPNTKQFNNSKGRNLTVRHLACRTGLRIMYVGSWLLLWA